MLPLPEWFIIIKNNTEKSFIYTMIAWKILDDFLRRVYFVKTELTCPVGNSYFKNGQSINPKTNTIHSLKSPKLETLQLTWHLYECHKKEKVETNIGTDSNRIKTLSLVTCVSTPELVIISRGKMAPCIL